MRCSCRWRWRASMSGLRVGAGGRRRGFALRGFSCCFARVRQSAGATPVLLLRDAVADDAVHLGERAQEAVAPVAAAPAPRRRQSGCLRAGAPRCR